MLFKWLFDITTDGEHWRAAAGFTGLSQKWHFPNKKGPKRESGSNSSILEHEIESSRQQQQKKRTSQKKGCLSSGFCRGKGRERGGLIGNGILLLLCAPSPHYIATDYRGTGAAAARALPPNCSTLQQQTSCELPLSVLLKSTAAFALERKKLM